MKVEAIENSEFKSSSKNPFGILEILVGDGKTGMSLYTVGGGKVNDADMSTGLVFALEQSIREHSGTAKDVFFGGINANGGIGWCVKEFEVAGEIRELYVGAALTPGYSYSLDIDTLEQKNKGKREFFVFLKDFLMPSIVRHLNMCIAKMGEGGGEANLDALLRTGISAFKKGEINQMVKSSADLGDSFKVFSEACIRAVREYGTVLRAISVDKKGFVESKKLCSEMISEYLEKLYETQNVKLGEGEWSTQRVLAPLKSGVDKSFDSWFRHIYYTVAETLFHTNPSGLLLIGDQKNYISLCEIALREKLREWGTRRRDFLVKKRYGSEFLYSVGSKFGSLSPEELSQRREEILDFLAVSMMDKLYEDFPLTALTYDPKKKTVLRNEMLQVIVEVIPIVEREVLENLFEKVKSEVFNLEKFTKDVFGRQKTEGMRRKIDDWINKLYKTLQEKFYQENPAFAVFPEPLEQFRTRIADFINERAVMCLKGDTASAIMLALKHLDQEVKEPAAAVYLVFLKELVKGFVGKEMSAIYPALGYLLKEANILDKLDDAFKVILKDTGYEDEKILENVSNEIKRVSEREIALNSSIENAIDARSILQEAIKKVLSKGDGLGGILLGDEN
ncbi:MAG: hypothetical protein QW279_04895 [Candidatus Jordarchaeaceae archaeon]